MPGKHPDTASAKRIDELETHIAYLERKLARTEQQQARKERIDDINRHLIKHVSAELEQALVLAEQGNRAKTEFLATMSHEIRSPLNIVLGMGELLAETKLDEQQGKYLQSLLGAGRQLFEQLTNVLEFSRLESGKIAVHREPFSFELLGSSLCALMETLAQDRGLEFRYQVPPDSLGERLGDLPKIKQILFNVLSNALKFTDHGAITLAIDQPIDHPVPDMVRFSITDSGIGIPQDRLDTIFERFTQVENGLSMHRGGTGLGLAICKRLVAKLRGEISVRSTLGHGSTFTILLPLPRAPDTGRRIMKNRRDLTDRTVSLALAAIRILVAEDVAGNVEVIERYLAPFDVEIDHAANGEEAVRLFAERRYDLVLMDIKMPGVDGITAMHRINELARSGANPAVPIVAVTAHAFPEQVLSYLKKGFTGVLTKPFTKHDLVKTISDFLRFNPRREQPHESPSPDRQAEIRADEVPEVLAPLLGRVIEALATDIDTVADQLCAGRLHEVKDACHASKGLAGLYGLHEFAALLAGLEQQIKTNDGPLDPDCLQPLREHLTRLRSTWQAAGADHEN